MDKEYCMTFLRSDQINRISKTRVPSKSRSRSPKKRNVQKVTLDQNYIPRMWVKKSHKFVTPEEKIRMMHQSQDYEQGRQNVEIPKYIDKQKVRERASLIMSSTSPYKDYLETFKNNQKSPPRSLKKTIKDSKLNGSLNVSASQFQRTLLEQKLNHFRTRTHEKKAVKKGATSKDKRKKEKKVEKVEKVEKTAEPAPVHHKFISIND